MARAGTVGDRWDETADGYSAGPYRVSLVKDGEGPPWQLGVEGRHPRLLGLIGRDRSSRHVTRSLAFAAARRMERERIRTIKFERAVASAVVGGIGLVALAAGSVGTAVAVLGSVLLYVVLRSLADAADLRLGGALGWPRDESHLDRATPVDRVVARVVERLRVPLSEAELPDEEDRRIVVA